MILEFKSPENNNMKIRIFYIFIIILIISAAVAGEYSDYFHDFRNEIRNKEALSPMLNRGIRGQIFKELGGKYIVPAESKSRKHIFYSRNVTNINSYRLTYEKLNEIQKDFIRSDDIITNVHNNSTILNINITEKDLYDNNFGIFKHINGHGRNWERITCVTLLTGSNSYKGLAGVRLYGDSSRENLFKNIKLFFRRDYCDYLPDAEILFSTNKGKYKSVIIRSDHNDFGFSIYNYANLMNLNFARQIGLTAPLTKSVQFYLNGEIYGSGQYYLLEDVDEIFFKNHFENKNFYFYDFEDIDCNNDEFYNFRKWFNNNESSMTINELSKKIDVNSIVDWWLLILFCSTEDYLQGKFYKEKENPDAVWKIIPWDMDKSFKKNKIGKKTEQHSDFETVPLLEENNSHILSRIIKCLIINDPDFTVMLNKRIKFVNSKLTTNFLEKRLQYYNEVCRDFDENYNNEINIKKLKEYFIARKKDMSKLLIKEILLYKEKKNET